MQRRKRRQTPKENSIRVRLKPKEQILLQNNLTAEAKAKTETMAVITMIMNMKKQRNEEDDSL